MRPLCARDIVSIWEWGQGRQAPERALGLLAAANPDVSWDELKTLTIGRRDAQLLNLRERTLGSRLQCFVECPRCAEQLQFSVDTEGMRVGDGDPGGEHEFQSEGYRVRFRMPNTTDLIAAAGCASTAQARLELLRRCVFEAHSHGELVAPAMLPESVVASLAERMEELDPQAELRLDLACPGCSHRWSTVLDIASFFFREICVLATKRLVSEVHTLARAYGWREADVLAMSSARRALYLELATT